MTDPKAKAQEIVDNYFNILFDDGDVNEIAICKHYAIACAISEVEGKIELFNEILESDLNNDFDILMRRGEYLAILQELKKMNQ